MKGKVKETIRQPVYGMLNAQYEVADKGKTVGYCQVEQGVITKLMVRDGLEEDFRGKAMSMLLGTCVREADSINANLSIQLVDYDEFIKKFFERFGFKHIGKDIYKRLAGSIVPPSVIL